MSLLVTTFAAHVRQRHIHALTSSTALAAICSRRDPFSLRIQQNAYYSAVVKDKTGDQKTKQNEKQIGSFDQQGSYIEVLFTEIL